MPRAGYCSSCQANVYLTDTGTCVNGHGAECISNAYEVPGATPAAPPAAPAPAAPMPAPAAYAPAPAYAQPAPAPKKKRTGLIITILIVALLLLCGCGIAGFLLFAPSSSDSTGSEAPAKTDPDKAKVKAVAALVTSFAKGDGGMMMSVMPAEAVAGVDSAFWDGFVKEIAGTAAVLGKQTWKGSSLTIATTTNQGNGTISLKVSESDPNIVESHTVRPDKTTSDSTVVLVNESGSWKIKSMTMDGQTLVFDSATLKALAAP